MAETAQVELRDGLPGDLDLLVELRLEYIRADLCEPDPDAEAALVTQLRTWIPANLGQRFFTRLAFVDAEPAAVAMLAVNEYPANPSFPNGRVGTVLNVWTRPPYRRRGLAMALMRELITLGESLEVSRLELRASGIARPLYEALGFVPAADHHLAMERPYARRLAPPTSAHQE